jgi:enoyl-CoA hydratase/carnithine racemase
MMLPSIGGAPVGLVERVREDEALEWVIDAPSRKNAITPAVLDWIAARCATLSRSVVVLRGEGPGFSSGFDLGALAEAAAAPSRMPDAALVAATAAMTSADATFVAAVHGFVIGAAVELFAACDLRIATDDATFRIPAARLGVVYHAEGVARLTATFGPTIAARLLLLGDRIGAAEAEAAGALARRVPPEDLCAAIDDLVQRCRSVDGASLGANRDLLRALRRGTLDDATRSAHERAREDAYARIDPRTVRPAKG